VLARSPFQAALSADVGPTMSLKSSVMGMAFARLLKLAASSTTKARDKFFFIVVLPKFPRAR
jgi:hypothetical protein